MKTAEIIFPEYAGRRCLMMPFVQGDPASVPPEFGRGYESIILAMSVEPGEIGYLTIDESPVTPGTPHRGSRNKWGRALHTEAGRRPGELYCWGGSWGRGHNVTLDRDVKVLLANNIDDSCALWPTEHEDTSIDGDIGYAADLYPYSDATMMMAGDVYQIGIFTPHESLPISCAVNRQFIRVVSSGVHGKAPYFTRNRLLETGSPQ